MEEIVEVEEVLLAQPVTSTIGMVVVRPLSPTLCPDGSGGRHSFLAEIFVDDDITKEALTKDIATSVFGFIRNLGLRIRFARGKKSRIKGGVIYYRIEKTPRAETDRSTLGLRDWFNQVANIISEALANYGYSLISLSPEMATFTMVRDTQ